MYELITSGKYRKDLKRANKRGYNLSLLKNIIKTLWDGKTLDEKYHDHPLSGDYEGSRECHIKPDWLLIYEINAKENTLTLSRTGTHSDLFE